MLRAAMAALALLLAAPLAVAAEDPFFDLGPDPLAQQVRALEPKALPPGGALDHLADTSRALRTDKTSSVDHELDERTSLNAIALSRRSGIPIAVDEIANVDDRASRETVATRSVSLALSDVLAALALGVGPIHGALDDVLSKEQRYTTSDRTKVAFDIADEDTMGGLALLARGIDFDPHELIHVEAIANGSSRTKSLAGLEPDPRYRQNVTLPLDTVAAALPIFQAERTVDPATAANVTMRTSDNGRLVQENSLPEEVILGALAFDANGIPVTADDVMSRRADKGVERIHQVASDIDLPNLVGVLLLGVRAK